MNPVLGSTSKHAPPFARILFYQRAEARTTALEAERLEQSRLNFSAMASSAEVDHTRYFSAVASIIFFSLIIISSAHHFAASLTRLRPLCLQGPIHARLGYRQSMLCMLIRVTSISEKDI